MGIYSQSGKFADAERIHKLLVRKFNKEKEVWIKFGIFYYKNNKLNDGRFILQRSLQSLDKRDHIEISSKFAQIEFRYESQRGERQCSRQFWQIIPRRRIYGACMLTNWSRPGTSTLPGPCSSGWPPWTSRPRR